MAITVNIIQNPNMYAPGYSRGEWIVLNSASSSVSNFEYLIDLYTYNQTELAATASYIQRFKTAPAPGNGYGAFSPINILNSYLSYDFTPNGTQSGATNSILYYGMQYGFQYSPNLTYSNVYNSNNFVALTFSTPHNLLNGDIITIDKWNITVNPQYNGTASITGVPNSLSIITNVIFGATSGSDPGQIDYLERMVGTISNSGTPSNVFYMFNGARQYFDIGFDYSNFVANSHNGTAQILSRYGETYVVNGITYSYSTMNGGNGFFKPVYTGTYETVSILNNYANGNPTAVSITQYDSNFNTLTSSFVKLTSNNSVIRRQDIGSGPGQLKNLYSILNTNTVYYTFDILGLDSNVSFGYQIINPCTFYANYKIAWLNDYGGIDYYDFYRDSKITFQYTRNQMQKILPYNYTMPSVELDVMSVDKTQTFLLNSDWVTEYDIHFLEGLFASKRVYLLDSYNYSQNYSAGGNVTQGSFWVPITVTDNGTEINTSARDKIFNKQINVSLAITWYGQIS